MQKPTGQEIDKLKARHGRLFLVEVEPEEKGGETLTFIFCRPDRKTLSAAAKLAHSDPFQASEVTIKNCLVWGDVKHLDDMSVFSSVAEHFEEINRARNSTLKNL